MQTLGLAPSTESSPLTWSMPPSMPRILRSSFSSSGSPAMSWIIFSMSSSQIGPFFSKNSKSMEKKYKLTTWPYFHANSSVLYKRRLYTNQYFYFISIESGHNQHQEPLWYLHSFTLFMHCFESALTHKQSQVVHSVYDCQPGFINYNYNYNNYRPFSN